MSMAMWLRLREAQIIGNEMQSNTTIDEVFAALLAEIDAIIQLTQNGAGGRRSLMINRESRQARTALIKARSRYKDLSAQKPHVNAPASSSLEVKQHYQRNLEWVFCGYCDAIINNEQMAAHLWTVHRRETDNRNEKLRRAAAELQQRDNDLYRDD